jgi:YD repeat-containing protein
VHYWGPPYAQVAYMYFGPWPTVSIALQMYWAAYQNVWHMPQCTWPVTYYKPTDSNGGGVAWVDLGNGCGGDGFVVRATQYTYDPAKNLGRTCHCVADPINTATGNEYRDEEDFSRDSLSFHRYYNSHVAVASSHIGNNWRHSFDRSVEYHASGNLTTATVFRPDGHQIIFTLTSGQWAADPDVADRLTAQTNTSGAITGWAFFDAATRCVENYDQDGNLVSIIDTDGLVTTLTYSTASTPTNVAPVAGLLLTITDPRGRALSFTYNSNSEITTITQPDGGVLTYGYNTSGNLTSVTSTSPRF